MSNQSTGAGAMVRLPAMRRGRHFSVRHDLPITNGRLRESRAQARDAAAPAPGRAG